MAGWPLPLYHDPKWEVSEDPLAALALDQLLSDGKHRIGDSWNMKCDVLATRLIHYPFYPGAVGVELRIELPFEEGVVLGSWLAYEPSEESSSDDDDDDADVDDESETQSDRCSLIFLNGSSSGIHELNAKLPIDIPDEETAEAYLKFFCANVWGELGAFWICSAEDDVPLAPDADQAGEVPELPEFTPPEYEGKNEQGHFLFHATVRYGSALFNSHFAVQPGGMIEMIDDDSLCADLPIVPDQRISGLRALQ